MGGDIFTPFFTFFFCFDFVSWIFIKTIKLFGKVKAEINRLILTQLTQSYKSCFYVGVAKVEHFSFIPRSCQRGLREQSYQDSPIKKFFRENFCILWIDILKIWLLRDNFHHEKNNLMFLEIILIQILDRKLHIPPEPIEQSLSWAETVCQQKANPWWHLCFWCYFF